MIAQINWLFCIFICQLCFMTNIKVTNMKNTAGIICYCHLFQQNGGKWQISVKRVICDQICFIVKVAHLPAGYDEYSLLNLYSGFFLLLVPYSENLLLDRVASNSKKATIFQLLDTDNNVFWCISFFLIKHFCKSAICVHLASWCLIFCQHLRPSLSPMLRISWTISMFKL